MGISASELRIGNYVNVLGQVDKVSLIGENKNGGYCHFEETRPGYYLENYNDELVTGIELTEEWLIKMGFNKKPNGYIILTEMKQALLVSFGNHNISINGVSFRNDFKYLHQLQNIIFALTGEELTIKN